MAVAHRHTGNHVSIQISQQPRLVPFERPSELLPSFLIVLNGLLTGLAMLEVEIRGSFALVRLQGG
jgi:hypothetical protein